MTRHSPRREPGPERELLKLLRNPDPEVRGLAAILSGKLVRKIGLVSDVGDAVKELLHDSDSRVVECAQRVLASFENRHRLMEQLPEEERVILSHGHYEELESFQTALIVYQGTVAFCDRFVSLRSRTHDQMVQAARSGKQNIVEGCSASGISKKTEIKLVGVARASLDELLEDYRDFLRHKDLPIWDKEDPRVLEIRRLAFEENRTYETYKSYIEKAPPETAANAMLCLVHQANYLLDRQLRSLEQTFLKEGGFSERLYRARRNWRDNRKNRIGSGS